MSSLLRLDTELWIQSPTSIHIQNMYLKHISDLEHSYNSEISHINLRRLYLCTVLIAIRGILF